MRLVMAFLLGVLALAGCDKQSAPAPQDTASPRKVAKQAPSSEELQGETIESGTLDISKRGAPAPDFSFDGPDGAAVKLSQFQGKPVLVNLWATWCGPCVKEMPTLDALAQRTDGRLVVLTVSQDIKGAKLVDPWFAAHSFRKIGAWLDPRGQFLSHYGSGMLPTTILYDAQGKEVWRVVGAMDWNGARANTLLAEVL